MSIGRVCFAWTTGAAWVFAGVLLLFAGYFMEPYVIAGLGSIALGLFVAAVPIRPVAELSGVLTLPCIGLACILGILAPSVAPLCLVAVTVYVAIAVVSAAVCLSEPGIAAAR